MCVNLDLALNITMIDIPSNITKPTSKILSLAIVRDDTAYVQQ